MWGVQGWWTSLLPHLPSPALGDGPVRVLPSIPGASLSLWQSRAGHWLSASRGFALYQDLQQGRGRCQPAVNATDPEQSNLWGPGSTAKAGGAVNHCSIQAPPASLTHGSLTLLCGWRGTSFESCSSCPGGHSPGWELHWPPCLLWSCAGPGAQAGREGAGQGRTQCSGRQRKWCFLQSAVGLPAAHGGTAHSQPHMAWGQGWDDFPSCLLSLMDVSPFYNQLDFFLPCSLLGPGKLSQPLISLHHSLPSTTAYPGSCHPHRDRGTRSCHRTTAGLAGLAAISKGYSPPHGCRFGLGLTTAAFFTCALEMPAALPWVPLLLMCPGIPFPGLLGMM